MSNWNVYTAEDALDGLSDAERTAVNNFAGKDKLPGIVNDVVAAFRGAVAARQAAGPAGTVPDSLRHYVGHAAIAHFLLGVPGVLMTQERKDAAKHAEEILDQLRKGELRVELPDEDEFSRGTIRKLTANERSATAAKLTGL